MRKNRWYRLHILLLVALFLWGNPAWAEIPTPAHEKLACVKCHQTDGEGHPRKALIFGPDVLKLCESCHAQTMIHPVGMVLKNRTVLFALLDLPLGQGPFKGEVTCLTCHKIHLRQKSPYLLRGQSYTAEEEEEEGPVPERNDYAALCAACHLEGFSGKNPHAHKPEDCKYCHLVSTKRIKGSPRLAHFLGKYACTPCHQDVGCAYDPGYDPYLDPVIRKKAKEMGITLPEGPPLCSTCHEPHASSLGNYFLRREYLPLARLSRSINPHWKELFCLCCHAQEPERGKPRLKETDYNRLCERCHDNRFARADIHPVGIKPSQQVKIPPYLPLQNGVLTCETCHNALLQCYLNENAEKRNPKFLRREGLPRYKFCFLCHISKEYQRLNPHEHQLDEKGHIVEKRCLICHSAIPDTKHVKGTSHISFSVKDPDECCRGCHPGYDKYHPAGYTHVGVRPSPKIMRAIKTSIQRIGVEVPLYDGRVICASCHNPHEKGVIKFRAAATGSTRANKLRLPATMEMCIACHADKDFLRKGYRPWRP